MGTMGNFTHKYYGYYRCSTSTQVNEGYGLDTQRDSIEEWAGNNGIEVSEYFHDDGISGTDAERDGLTDLLAAMEKDDRVIVLNTSRLWRGDAAKVLVHHSLKKINADIISIEQPNYTIYSKDPSEFLFNGMMELLDQYSRLEINMKLAKGRRTKAKKGCKSCGSAPIGYLWHDADIEIDSENAIIVTDIFRAYVELKTLGKVAEYCKVKGYKTLPGNDFSKQSIKNILTNDFYVGVVTHAGQKYSGTHLGIIEIELFNTVQTMMGKSPIEKEDK